METISLKIHPQILDLYEVLEQNGLHKQKEDVQSLVGYIENMEYNLSVMMNEIQDMHTQVNRLNNRGLRAQCSKIVSKAEEKIQQAKTMVSVAKVKTIQSAGNVVKIFQEKGRSALIQVVTAMRIPAALEHLKSGMHRSAEAMRDSVGRIDAMREELHEVGQHLKNAGRTLFGKPAREAEKLDADKGVLAMLRRFMEGAGSKFADMEQGADKLISKIQGRESVKSELQVLTSERRKAAKAPTVHEQAR